MKNNKDKRISKKYYAIDMFCGAGGLSRGFLDASFEVLFGVDYDEAALKTFEANHDGAEAIKLDLFDFDNINVIVDKLNQKKINIDVLIGGPPCQGFSLAGKREKNDKRNILYYSMVQTAEILKPRIVILENVPGMLTLHDGIGAKMIKDGFENIGYSMQAKVLYAPNYGIPQIRKRVIFVGVLNCENTFQYPEPKFSKENYITCREAISDLPTLENDFNLSLDVLRDYICNSQNDYQKLMRNDSKKVYNHIPTNHTQKTINNISLVPEGGNYKNLPSHMVNNFKYHESLTRYHGDKPSLTIDTGHRTHFHYKYNRIPTVRENARLQSFPDTFIFYGNKQQQYKQVGNAVPPLLGKAIAEKVKEFLDNEE